MTYSLSTLKELDEKARATSSVRWKKSRKRIKAANDPKNIHRRCLTAMNFPVNTCPASRHVRIMGDVLMHGKKYHMFEEEPEHCAGSLLATVEALWKCRTELAYLRTHLPAILKDLEELDRIRESGRKGDSLGNDMTTAETNE